MKKSFTLVELMIVIAILAILSAIVLFALNPIRLFDNFRDTRRVADINTINKAINFVETWNTDGISYGTSTIVYTSLPDSSTICSSYSLPTLPVGYSYNCVTASALRKVDSTGWIPIDFSINQSNSYLNVLPIDPVNDTTYYYTYYPGGSYVLTNQLANANSISINDSGDSGLLFETGTPNYTSMPVVRDSSLVGYWSFDEGSGATTYDKSGHGRTGTLNGPEWIELSSGEKVLYYDVNAADYVSTTAASILNTGIITVEAWMKSQIQSAQYQQIFVHGARDVAVGFIYFFRNTGSNTIMYEYANGSAHPEMQAANYFLNLDNQWIHIVAVVDYSNKIGKFYRNGVQFSTDQTLTGNPVFPSGSSVEYIGARISYADKIKDGYIDDLKIYNRGLSASEIESRYNKTRSKYQ